jgi:hypothetical protein
MMQHDSNAPDYDHADPSARSSCSREFYEAMREDGLRNSWLSSQDQATIDAISARNSRPPEIDLADALLDDPIMRRGYAVVSWVSCILMAAIIIALCWGA